MKSPWKQLMPLDGSCEYVALASLIPPKSRRSTWRLFRGSRAVTAQLGKADGVVGFAMLARPVKKEYATLSLWIDDAALDAFSHAGVHRELQQRLAHEMGDTAFVRWSVAGSDGVPTWRDALVRLRGATSSRDGAG